MRAVAPMRSKALLTSATVEAGPLSVRAGYGWYAQSLTWFCVFLASQICRSTASSTSSTCATTRPLNASTSTISAIEAPSVTSTLHTRRASSPSATPSSAGSYSHSPSVVAVRCDTALPSRLATDATAT